MIINFELFDKNLVRILIIEENTNSTCERKCTLYLNFGELFLRNIITVASVKHCHAGF